MSDSATRGPVQGVTVIEYLLEALAAKGVRHIFGIPGDFTLTACAAIERSSIEFVLCRNELNAGYAAESYARVAGLGVVTATYSVGAYCALNAVALANAEETPLLMLTGSPGVVERINDPELHHKSGSFDNQAETFRRHTAASAVIMNPLTAFAEIDRVLNEVVLHRRPGYLELPRDMVEIVPATEYFPQRIKLKTDTETLGAVVSEAADRLAKAKNPVVVAGVEIHRFGVQHELLRLLEGTGIPVATTLLGKSAVSETHPLFMGLYAGTVGDPQISRYVEESDCVLFAGVVLSDIDVGRQPKYRKESCIFARNGHFQCGGRHFFGVQLADFLPALTEQLRPLGVRPAAFPKPSEIEGSAPADGEGITTGGVIQVLNEHLDDKTLVVCDVGDSLFASVDLHVPAPGAFLANTYYASMGHAIPAAVGAHFGLPDFKVVVLVGDGAFQMTFQEISTAVQHDIPMTVIVLDNHGYETERRLFPGAWKFNDIPAWEYSKVTEVFGGGTGVEVSTVGELRTALAGSWTKRGVTVIHVRLPAGDASRTLKRIGLELQVPGTE